MKRTVINLLKTATTKYKGQVYVSEKADGKWINKTYEQVDNESDQIAMALLQMGYVKDDKIAILSEGRSDWVIGEYGITKAGCIAVPLSIKLMPEEVLFRLNHSGSKAIFVSRNTIEKLAPVWKKIDYKKFKIICYDPQNQMIDRFKEFGKSMQDRLIDYEELKKQGQQADEKAREQLRQSIDAVAEDDVVTISYTSGTTGNPKGIMLTQLNYYSNSKDAFEYFTLPYRYKTLIILPLDHSFAHTVGIYISLLCGLSIYFVDGRDGPVNTLKNIPVNLKEVKPDILLTVPALTGNFMKKITDGIYEKGGFVKNLFNAGLKAGMRINGDGYKKAGFFVRLINFIPYKIADALVFSKVRQIFGGNLKFCVGGGALLDIRQQRFFYTLGAPIYQGYGLTEATPIISANCVHTHKLGTSGGLINNVTCRIIKSDGTQAAKGEKGEILIKGNNVMKGYYKNKEASDEVLLDGWLRTGDMGYIDEDDFLMVVGREKALLIAEDGEKYSPESIEEAIVNTADLIMQCMVYNDHKKYTTALITIDKTKLETYRTENNIEKASELIDAIKKSFYAFREEEDYKDVFPAKWIPSMFRIIEEPFSEQNKMINSTMKMVRFKITEVYQDVIDQMYDGRCSSIKCEENKQAVENILA